MTTASRPRRALVGLGFAGVLALGACSSGSGGGSTVFPAASDAGTAGAASSAATAATTGEVKQVTVVVAGGKVTPPTSTITVPKGQVIRLTVTSDKIDEVHVHGIDKEMELPTPGTPGTLVFTASLTGSFEVETHKTNLLLFKLDVTG